MRYAIAVAAVALCCALGAGPSRAAKTLAKKTFAWSVDKIDDEMMLTGMLGDAEDEPDYLFWLSCKSGGAMDMGVGADVSVGRGTGEPVTLTGKGGGAEFKIEGVSRNSKNSEMTGANELVKANVTLDEPVIKALAQPQASVTIVGGKQRFTLPGKDFAAKLAAFRKGCGK
jgi:hypothetical protein